MLTQGSFCDISALLPLLGQLRSLCIFDTYNMQVPYLLSHLLQTTLPNLRSLEVKQNFMTTQADSLEGVHWSPTAYDGGACVLATQSKGYISFLVKACPNLEELGFLGRHFYEDEIMVRILRETRKKLNKKKLLLGLNRDLLRGVPAPEALVLPTGLWSIIPAATNRLDSRTCRYLSVPGVDRPPTQRRTSRSCLGGSGLHRNGARCCHPRSLGDGDLQLQ